MITYSKPKLAAPIQKSVDAGEFDFLMPFEKPLYRTDEVGKAIGREQAFVRALIEAGRLEAHQDSAFGIRKSNLVTRRSVLLYLAETANYDPSFFVIRIEALMKNLKPHHLNRLVTSANKLLQAIR